jgi:phosphotransferase system enzyme I (PtsI)
MTLAGRAGFPHGAASAALPHGPLPRMAGPRDPADLERVLSGEVASPGLSFGTIHVDRPPAARDRGPPAPVQRRRLARALAAATGQLAELGARGDAISQATLDAQIALLNDAALIIAARVGIGRGLAAAQAWQQAVEARLAGLESDDPAWQSRAADLRDVRDRVVAVLLEEAQGVPAPPGDAIHVAEDLTPARFLEIDWQHARGAVLTGGSAMNHVAALARGRGVPLLVGLGTGPDELEEGSIAILDAEAGRLILAPRQETVLSYSHRVYDRTVGQTEAARQMAQPPITAGGRRIRVLLTVDDATTIDRVVPAHVDGIGMTRTEFLFPEMAGLPDEGTQYRAYDRLVRWAEGRPVTIRTFDAGGDKQIRGLTDGGERNPFLGVRGIRLLLGRPDLFHTQLRALARAAADGPLRVILPMVTTPEEFARARAMLDEAMGSLAAEGMPARRPALGLMVEVPAAALTIDRFDADFLSIGSNDLLQYVTAASRDNAAVTALLDPLSPALLELVGRVVEHAHRARVPVGVCGDMVGRPEALALLLDLGVDEVSVSATAIARVKTAIARHGARA